MVEWSLYAYLLVGQMLLIQMTMLNLALTGDV
jgi:hypothetical protein